MVLRIKNLKILGVCWKKQISGGGGGGGLTKNQNTGGQPNKGGLDSLLTQGRELAEGVLFLRRGGWYSNAHYVLLREQSSLT